MSIDKDLKLFFTLHHFWQHSGNDYSDTAHKGIKKQKCCHLYPHTFMNLSSQNIVTLIARRETYWMSNLICTAATAFHATGFPQIVSNFISDILMQ